jgi:hypothetical protein
VQGHATTGPLNSAGAIPEQRSSLTPRSRRCSQLLPQGTAGAKKHKRKSPIRLDSGPLPDLIILEDTPEPELRLPAAPAEPAPIQQAAGKAAQRAFEGPAARSNPTLTARPAEEASGAAAQHHVPGCFQVQVQEAGAGSAAAGYLSLMCALSGNPMTAAAAGTVGGAAERGAVVQSAAAGYLSLICASSDNPMTVAVACIVGGAAGRGAVVQSASAGDAIMDSAPIRKPLNVEAATRNPLSMEAATVRKLP